MQVIARQGDTVDAICARELGRTAAVTEAVFAANAGLADLGPVLPHGTRVQIPESVQATPSLQPRIQLWD